MDQRGSKRESEHDLRVKVESSDPIDLASSPSPHSTGPQEQPSSNGFVATGSSYSSVDFKPGEQTVDETQLRNSQPDSNVDVDVWTMKDLVHFQQTSQEDFMAEFRNSAAQNNFQLVQALQSEVQAGMNQIVDHVKHMMGRSTQASTHAEIEILKNQLRSEIRHSKDLQNNYNLSEHTVKQQQKEIQKANSKVQDALQERPTA